MAMFMCKKSGKKKGGEEGNEEEKGLKKNALLR